MRRSKHNEPISLFSFQDLMISMIGVFIIIALLLILLITKQVAETVEQSSISVNPDILDQLQNSEEEIKQLEALLSNISKIDSWEVTKKTFATKDKLLSIDLDLVEIREKLEAARKELDRIIVNSELEGDVGVGLSLRKRRDTLQLKLDETRLRDRIVYLVSETESKKPLIMELSQNQIILSRTDQSIAPSLNNDFEFAVAEIEPLLKTGEYYLLIVLKPSGMILWRQVKKYVVEQREAGFNIDIGLDLIAENHGTTNLFITPSPL